MSRATQLYAIGVGSNRPHGRHGPPAQVVAAAIARLDHDFGLFDASPLLVNPAEGGAGREFANAVAIVESELEPPALLGRLKAIEREFGRRPGRRWGARVVDLDIIAWSGGCWRSRGLIVPHPAAARRLFVIGPLAAIAPHWRLVGPLTARHLAFRLRSGRPVPQASPKIRQ